ncbi:MAG: penicillin-binding protein activator [Magnetococcus sp. DMHC-8]
MAGLLWGCAEQKAVAPVAQLPEPVRVVSPKPPPVPVRNVPWQPLPAGALPAVQGIPPPASAGTPSHAVAGPVGETVQKPVAAVASRQSESPGEAALLQGELLHSQGMLQEAWQQWSPVVRGADTPMEARHADTAWRRLFESYFKQGDRDNTPRFLQEIADLEPTAQQNHVRQDLAGRQSRERLNQLLSWQPSTSPLIPVIQHALLDPSLVRQDGGLSSSVPLSALPVQPVPPGAGNAQPGGGAVVGLPHPEGGKVEGPPSPEVTGPVLKVGLLVPLSGKWTSMGEHLRRAAKKALADYPSLPIQLLIADSGDAADTSHKAINELVAQQVDVVVGPVFYPTVQPAVEVAAAHHIPIITLNPQRDADRAMRGAYSNAFQPEQQAKIMARHAVLDKKYARIAILAPDSEYGRGVAKTFGDEVQALGGAPVRSAFFTQDATDFSASLRTLGVHDALFLPASAKQVRLIAPQAANVRSGSNKVALLGTALWNSPELLTEGTDYMEGAIFCDIDTAIKEQFRQSFRQTWEEDPSTLATLAYDGVAVVAQLLQEQRQGGKEWHTALTRPAGFQGASGPLRFLENGQSRRLYHLFQVEHGRIRVLQPFQDSLAIP